MEPVILTPRLKLTRIINAERGSPEFKWLHELRSDEKSTWWSIHGRSKSVEDTENQIKGVLPINGKDGSYRIAYAVHELVNLGGVPEKDKSQANEQSVKPTKVIGLVTLRSLEAGGLELPEALTIPITEASTTLTVELAYSLLPSGWGKGYAAESVKAVFEFCKRETAFWSPYSKVYIRAIVNHDNPASLRVMEKIGMKEKGIYHWTGKAIFLAGQWRTEDHLHIFGSYLIE